MWVVRRGISADGVGVVFETELVGIAGVSKDEL